MRGQQLDRCGGRRLMIIDGTSSKPQLLTVDMIMIISTDISLSPRLRWEPSGAEPTSKPLK